MPVGDEPATVSGKKSRNCYYDICILLRRCARYCTGEYCRLQEHYDAAFFAHKSARTRLRLPSDNSDEPITRRVGQCPEFYATHNTMSAVIRIGTSGFSYKEWLGGFYPEKLPGTKMLAHYATRLPTVEINYTFRAMPKREMLDKWAAQTPEHFRFALKAPQRITHFQKLKQVDNLVGHFAEVASAMASRLGPALFQLPPNFRRDVPLLRDFLAMLHGRLRPAFEFRDQSWFDDSVLEALREGGAALCIAESETIASPVEVTAPFVYLRLRNEDYSPDETRQWAERISRMAVESSEIYIFFKHETSAPDRAFRLRELLPGAL